MPLQLSNATFAWPGAPAPALASVDLVLGEGWTAILGANGAGKSTLLHGLAGGLRPTSGAVRGPEAHLCPQPVEALDDAIVAFAWDGASLARRWRARLRLDPVALDRWPTMSPGERKRWQLGAALAADPPALLLDEPTNHLDADGRALLVEALRGWRGIGALVSHDRALLDALCARTVLVEGGRTRAISLPPSEALALRRRERAEALDALDAAQHAARRADGALGDARRGHQAAERTTSTAARVKGPRDHDGRSSAAKARAANGERATARVVERSRAAAERAHDAVEALGRPDDLGRAVFAHYDPPPRELLLARSGPLVVGGRALLGHADLALRRGAHVHLAGPNGAGKTTLLRALLGESGLPAHRAPYVPQDLGDADTLALLAQLRALAPAARGRVLQRVAALGVSPAALLATPRPSPGEARKLAIALGLGASAWLLALDEPTNHLDLPSIERLEDALAAWPGALLLATHDDALARACCDERWTLADGALRVATLERDPHRGPGLR